jgi:hypothetical protein
VGIGVRSLVKYRKVPSDAIVGGTVPEVEDPPPALVGEHPRTFVAGAAGLAAQRAAIAASPARKTRWQTAINSFFSTTGTWNTAHTNPGVLVFASYLMMHLADGHGTGLTLPASMPFITDTPTRAKIVAEILDRVMNEWAGVEKNKGIAWALVYDFLYPDLSSSQISYIHAKIEEGYSSSQNTYMSNAAGAGVEVYDGGASDPQIAKILCAIASENYISRQNEAYAAEMRRIDTYNWQAFGFGLGREFHEGPSGRMALPLILKVFQNAYGYTDAQTFDRFTTFMQEAWWLARMSAVPAPGVAQRPDKCFIPNTYHTQDSAKVVITNGNLGVLMLGSMLHLPGKLKLTSPRVVDGVSYPIANQSTLANSEAAFFAHMRHVFNESPHNITPLTSCVDYSLVADWNVSSANAEKFWGFDYLLGDDVQYTGTTMTETEAGIPLIRRFWPGTLDWTIIRSSWSKIEGSWTHYRHRRWGFSNYEEGARQAGTWNYHRNGFLFLQRGGSGHAHTTKRHWWCANGVVGHVDPVAGATRGGYAQYEIPNSDNGDNGGTRHTKASNTSWKDPVIASPTCDFGSIEKWYADNDIVAISDNLSRAYNGTEVQNGQGTLQFNDRKIVYHTREFVMVQRGADGTDHDHIFTFDRIKYRPTNFAGVAAPWIPHYPLQCPTTPVLDGTETPDAPQGPTTGSIYGWHAVGDNFWTYPGSTYVEIQNRTSLTLPAGTDPGNGKARAYWLLPTPANATIKRQRGTNVVRDTGTRGNGYPYFSPWRGWKVGDAEDWASIADEPDQIGYSGTDTVFVTPTSTAAPHDWVNDQGYFFIAMDGMDYSDTPATAELLTSDASSYAGRCGASAVSFCRANATTRSSGNITIPSGVTFVVLANLPVSAARTVSGSGTLQILSSNRTATDTGVLTLDISGAGTLTFS